MLPLTPLTPTQTNTPLKVNTTKKNKGTKMLKRDMNNKATQNKINERPLIDLKEIKITKGMNKKKVTFINYDLMRVKYTSNELSNDITLNLNTVSIKKELRKKLNTEINATLKETILKIKVDLKELKLENKSYSNLTKKNLLKILHGRYDSKEQIINIAFFIMNENLTIDYNLAISVLSSVKLYIGKSLLSKSFVNNATNEELVTKISEIKSVLSIKSFDLTLIK